MYILLLNKTRRERQEKGPGMSAGNQQQSKAHVSQTAHAIQSAVCCVVEAASIEFQPQS